jgi:hypothetical protein
VIYHICLIDCVTRQCDWLKHFLILAVAVILQDLLFRSYISSLVLSVVFTYLSATNLSLSWNIRTLLSEGVIMRVTLELLRLRANLID